MDKKSKIFFLVFFLLIVGSVWVTYYKMVVKHDYIIHAQTDCDPYTEACFVSECDPEADTCTGDPTQDTSYYKLITRNAKNIPLCDPAQDTCDALVCAPDEADCSYTLCDESTIEDGTTCNDPVTYTAENPLETEGATDGTVDETSGGETLEGGADTPSQDGNNNATADPVTTGAVPQQ